MSSLIIQDILSLETPNLSNNDLADLKHEGFKSLKQLGFPTTKHEEWKYTNVSPLIKKSFNLQPDSNLDEEAVKKHLFPDDHAHRLVFVNGKFNSKLSRLSNEELVAVVKPLSSALSENRGTVDQHLGKYIKVNNEAFSALNTSDLSEGVFVHVLQNKSVESPLYIYYITDASKDNVFYQPRNLFIIEKNAELKIVETYRSLGINTSFTNAITEMVVGNNSHVSYYKIQDNQGDSYQVETTEVHQSTDSVVSCFTATVGGHLVRNNLNFRLDDKNCQGNMYGLYLVGSNMHVDNHTVVDHMKPNSLSNELYKGVLGGNGKGVFNGKIFVRQDAQKTEAFQSNKNVLLSDLASINTKPQLEIWADDVKCSHGATCGQLDETALFYLRARGIGMAKAKALLTRAFANDVLDKINIDSLKKELEDLIEKKLDNL